MSTLFLTACSHSSDRVDATKLGQVISPDHRKTAGDLHGDLITATGSYDLASDTGHVVLLNFFGSWCGPCQAETPQVDSVYRDVKASGIRVVGIAEKDPSKDTTRTWLTGKQITFPVLWDQPGKLVIQLGHIVVPGIPFSVLIDKHGRIAAFYAGLAQPADLTPALHTLAAET